MALTDGNGLSAADVAAVMGNGGVNSWGGDGAWWLIILFLFAMNGNGWGYGAGAQGSAGDIQRGFDQQSVMSSLGGLNAAVGTGFANAEVSRCNAQANILQTLNANQNATSTAMNALAMSLQNCCCENRSQIADVKYAIVDDGNKTRDAVQSGVQLVLDKLCQQEIDALKAQNANLQTQINLANMQATYNAGAARILADNAAQTQALEQYLNPVPIPAYMVQNPNCCGQNWYNACNCGA